MRTQDWSKSEKRPLDLYIYLLCNKNVAHDIRLACKRVLVRGFRRAAGAKAMPGLRPRLPLPLRAEAARVVTLAAPAARMRCRGLRLRRQDAWRAALSRAHLARRAAFSVRRVRQSVRAQTWPAAARGCACAEATHRRHIRLQLLRQGVRVGRGAYGALCPETFQHSTTLKKHVLVAHGPQNLFPCTLCTFQVGMAILIQLQVYPSSFLC